MTLLTAWRTPPAPVTLTPAIYRPGGPDPYVFGTWPRLGWDPPVVSP